MLRGSGAFLIALLVVDLQLGCCVPVQTSCQLDHMHLCGVWLKRMGTTAVCGSDHGIHASIGANVEEESGDARSERASATCRLRHTAYRDALVFTDHRRGQHV